LTRDEARDSLLNAALALARTGEKAVYRTLITQLWIGKSALIDRFKRAEWKTRDLREHPDVLAELANYQAS
jgi:hypothetical protein